MRVAENGMEAHRNQWMNVEVWTLVLSHCCVFTTFLLPLPIPFMDVVFSMTSENNGVACRKCLSFVSTYRVWHDYSFAHSCCDLLFMSSSNLPHCHIVHLAWWFELLAEMRMREKCVKHCDWSKFGWAFTCIDARAEGAIIQRNPYVVMPLYFSRLVLHEFMLHIVSC